MQLLVLFLQISAGLAALALYFIAFVSQLPSLLIIFINRQHIPDIFISVIRNDRDSMVLPDPAPTSNYYTAGSLNHCSNPAVDKAHASFYMTWKVQCGRNFYFMNQ